MAPLSSTTALMQVLEVAHLLQLFPWCLHCLSINPFRLFEPRLRFWYSGSRSYLAGTENNCLDMHNNEVNELQIIRRSPNFDYDKFNEFAKQNKDRFNILSTNMQSINSKFSELELFVDYLDRIDFKFNVICMQETWKEEGDEFSQFLLQHRVKVAAVRVG